MRKLTLLLVSFVAPLLLQAQPFCGGSTLTVGTGMTYSTIQDALDASVAGDLISVKALGSPYAGVAIISHGGTSTCPITIQGENSTVEINAPSSSGPPVRIDRSNYITLDTLHVDGTAYSCIQITNSDGFVVQNSEVDHCGVGASGQGILTGFSHLGLIQNNHSHHNGQHGIYVSNEDQPYTGVVVRGNESDHNAGAGMQMNGDCQSAGPTGTSTGILVGNIIERNQFHDNTGNGISVIAASYSLIRNNVIYNNGGAYIKLAAQNGCAQIPSYNVIVNNSLIATTTDATTGIRIADQSGASGSSNDWLNANNTAFNNLTVTADSRLCVLDSTSGACDSVGSSGMYFKSGYWATSANIATLNFTNVSTFDFSLQTGSPAIDAAGLVSTFHGGTVPQNDYLDNARHALSSGLCAGAYEYNGSAQGTDTTPPTTPGTPSGSAGAYQISLTWTASTDAREVLGYRVYRNGTLVAGTTTNAYTDVSVTPGTAYNYVVQAYDDGINYSSNSATASITASGVVGCMNADQTPLASAPLVGSPFRNVLIPDQTGSFTIEFDGSAYVAADNGAIGLSPALFPTNSFSMLAVIVRFNSSGNIDARNGGGYAADVTYPYTPATSYHFRVPVNLAAHTYSVYVSTGGGPETTLATNYGFRTEQNAATHLGYLVARDDTGTIAACAPTLEGVLLFDSAGAGLVPLMSQQTQNLADQSITTRVTSASGSGQPLLEKPTPNEICNPSCASNTYTLLASDHGKILFYGGSTSITVNMPTGLGASYGSTVFQTGTGTVTFAGSGLTLMHPNGTHTSVAGEAGVINCPAADTCALGGQVH